MARHKNIEMATSTLGYGVLSNSNDLLHAYGMTDKNILVWLPIMYDPDNNWFNMYGIQNNKNIIVEIANKDWAKNQWKLGILQQEVRRVITRSRISAQEYDYDDIGEYCTVLSYVNDYVSIYAKKGIQITQGNVLVSNDNRLIWTSGFAIDEKEAKKKLYDLTVDAIKVLQ